MQAADKAVTNRSSMSSGRWGMALRAFMCQNLITGCAFGGFGVAMLPLQKKYDVGAGAATLALSITMLTFGIVGPSVGTLIGRRGLRPTMLAGAVLSMLGYGLLAFAPSMTIVIALYALPVGIGMAMCGSLPSSVLASNWFETDPGRAVGLVNMPVMVVVLPLLALGVIEHYGLRGLFLLLASLCALLIPITLGVRDRPSVITANQNELSGGAGDQMLPSAALLRSLPFWMIVIGGGVLSGVGITGVSHIVALAIERGVPLNEAALLVSVMGGASVVGSLLTGLLCDRLGSARTLAVASVALCVSWTFLFATTTLMPMLLSVLIIGICGGGVFPCVNVLAGELYGMPTLPRALGLFGLMALPFSFLAPPLAGVLHDYANSYQPVVIIIVITCGIVSLGFYILARFIARRPPAPLLAVG